MSRLSNPNIPRHISLRARLTDGWRRRALTLKAIAFALIGVVNTLIDYSVFLAARAALSGSPAAMAAIDRVVHACGCASSAVGLLVVANMISWIVAVTSSYVMNSSITFAVESGRRLRWRDYFVFVVAGIVGWFANTATLVFAAQVLLFPVWLAKAAAVLASFVVNFSLSHFVVFRVRRAPAATAPSQFESEKKSNCRPKAVR